MKEYFSRITSLPKKWELVFWWVIRALMVFAIIDCAFGLKKYGFGLYENSDTVQIMQSAANLVLMFLWEIFQMFPKKNLLRNIPTYVQDFLIIGLFLASFGGAYANLYYSFKLYDVVFHTIGGMAGVFAGYEIVVAMQKRDRIKASISIVLLAAFGFSFFAGTGWELFEFIADQVGNGDAQHWSLELAQQAADQYGIGLPNIIPALDPMRYALIDTMEDIVFNTVGALLAYVILKICPYWHKGKRNVNDMFTDYVKSEKKETVTK